MQYNIVNYSHHAVRYIARIYLSYKFKFVPLDPFHLPHPSLLWHSPISSLCIIRTFIVSSIGLQAFLWQQFHLSLSFLFDNHILHTIYLPELN